MVIPARPSRKIPAEILGLTAGIPSGEAAVRR